MRLFDFMTLEKLSLSLKHYWATLQVVSECRKSQEIGQDTQAIVLIRLDLLFRFIQQSSHEKHFDFIVTSKTVVLLRRRVSGEKCLFISLE